MIHYTVLSYFPVLTQIHHQQYTCFMFHLEILISWWYNTKTMKEIKVCILLYTIYRACCSLSLLARTIYSSMLPSRYCDPSYVVTAMTTGPIRGIKHWHCLSPTLSFPQNKRVLSPVLSGRWGRRGEDCFMEHLACWLSTRAGPNICFQASEYRCRMFWQIPYSSIVQIFPFLNRSRRRPLLQSRVFINWSFIPFHY